MANALGALLSWAVLHVPVTLLTQFIFKQLRGIEVPTVSVYREGNRLREVKLFAQSRTARKGLSWDLKG